MVVSLGRKNDIFKKSEMTKCIYVAIKLYSVSNRRTMSFLSAFCSLSAQSVVMTATEYCSISEP